MIIAKALETQVCNCCCTQQIVVDEVDFYCRFALHERLARGWKISVRIRNDTMARC